MDLLRWIQLQISKIRPPVITRNVYFKVNMNGYDPEFIILKGPYRDTIVSIKNIRIGDDQGLILFDPTVKETSWKNHNFTLDKNFDIIVGKMFYNLIEESLNNYKEIREQVLINEDDGTDYIEEPTPQRTVYEKSSSVSKKRVFSRQKRKDTLPGSKRLHSKIQPPTDHGSDSDIFSE